MGTVVRSVLVLLALSDAVAVAQPNNPWVEFAANGAKLSTSIPVSSATTDADIAVGDVDQDGWLDVVIFRTAADGKVGLRRNLLLMNEGGVLNDRTALYAVASDVPGDQGFLTPTSDLGGAIADLDLDGRPDVVTATTLSDGQPAAIAQPRIYRNLGHSAGSWLGLRHESSRIPAFFPVGGGSAVAPRFSDVAVGDVNNDGAPDLHFVDHDNTLFSNEPAGADLNDRLLFNDGFGFFSDLSTVALSAQQLASGWGADNALHDLNQDGLPDVVRISFNNVTPQVRVIYNAPSSPGQFSTQGQQLVTGTPGQLDSGFGFADLNRDGRDDLFVSGFAYAAYRFNVSTQASGEVQWGATKLVVHESLSSQLAGGANVVFSDLDLDGWQDVLVTSASPDLTNQSMRMHIYHNAGGTIGSFAIVLKEESEFANSGPSGVGWKGVVGMGVTDLAGCFDVAAADFDRDGDDDLLLARVSGGSYWENQTKLCQEDLGFGGPGDLTLAICGDPLASGGTATLRIEHGTPNATAILLAGVSFQPTFSSAVFGTLVPVPVAVILPLPLNASGELSLPIPGGGGPLTAYAQVVAPDVSAPQGQEVSNALKITLLP